MGIDILVEIVNNIYVSNEVVIVPKYTGKFSVSGIGRVGTYAAAKRGHYCRPRRYWVIEEELPEVRITHGVTDGVTWESRTKQEAREDLGHFKTKTTAIQFLADYAQAHGLQMQGDLNGYPWLEVPTEEQKRYEFAEAQDEAVRAEVIAEHQPRTPPNSTHLHSSRARSRS